MNAPHLPKPSQILIEAAQAQVSLPFECQPLFTRTGEVFGHELLYRGLLPQAWIHVDSPVLRHLGRVKLDMNLLFVNIANESLLAISDEAFILASQRNKIVFELSEVFTGSQTIHHISAKVNRLIEHGVRFALDDFGNGADGLHRLYALKRVACVKIDGTFMRLCLERKDAAIALKSLILEWKKRDIIVVAEWIETQDLLSLAHSLDIDLTQGWYVDALYAPEEQSLVLE